MLFIRLEDIMLCLEQVENDALRCSNRTAVLTHDPSDIQFGRSFSASSDRQTVNILLNVHRSNNAY